MVNDSVRFEIVCPVTVKGIFCGTWLHIVWGKCSDSSKDGAIFLQLSFFSPLLLTRPFSNPPRVTLAFSSLSLSVSLWNFITRSRFSAHISFCISFLLIAWPTLRPYWRWKEYGFSNAGELPCCVLSGVFKAMVVVCLMQRRTMYGCFFFSITL